MKTLLLTAEILCGLTFDEPKAEHQDRERSKCRKECCNEKQS